MILRRKVEPKYSTADFYCVTTAKLENVGLTFSSLRPIFILVICRRKHSWIVSLHSDSLLMEFSVFSIFNALLKIAWYCLFKQWHKRVCKQDHKPAITYLKEWIRNVDLDLKEKHDWTSESFPCCHDVTILLFKAFIFCEAISNHFVSWPTIGSVNFKRDHPYPSSNELLSGILHAVGTFTWIALVSAHRPKNEVD